MNGRPLARIWPFKRYKAFERELRNAAEWFSNKGLATHSKIRDRQKINCTSWHLHYLRRKWDFSPAF